MQIYIKKINDNFYYYQDKEMTILHREDGPAIEYADGEKRWYLNGQVHREDGPAVERCDGSKRYYYKSKLFSEIKSNEQWIKKLKLKNFW